MLVTKIDNTENSRPQVGLKKADLITEELVEGGMTRLAVFFYQQLPDVAGPVRSMRASDIGIVKPAHGVIVASGAAPPTLARMKRANVTFFEEGGPGYFREGSRSAPYNLMVQMPTLAKAVEKKAIVPASYLPWGKEADFSGGRPARSLDAIFSRSHTTSWTYRGGRYVNENSNAGPRVSGSSPTACWSCAFGRETPATSTRPATRSPRRSTSARVRRCSSTRDRSCAAPGRSGPSAPRCSCAPPQVR